MITTYNKLYPSVSTISMQQIREIIQNRLVYPHCDASAPEKYIIIDVRSQEEYNMKHAADSINIPHEIFLESEEEPLNAFLKQYGGQNCSLIFHCFYSSIRSPSAASAFALYLKQTEQEHLFNHLYVLKGGGDYYFCADRYPNVVE